MALGTECAGYPSQLAAVRAMALAGVGRAEIRQRTGLDSHRVGSLLAKVRAEARGDAPAWDAAREASARRIYRAGVLVMAEHFGVTVAEFLLHATGVPGAGQEASADGVLGPEGWSDGDVGAAELDGAGEPADRDAGVGIGELGLVERATAPRPDAPPPPPPVSEPVPGDAGEDHPAAPAADTAARGAAGEPGAEAGAQAEAAAEAALLVDGGDVGAEAEVRLSAPPAAVEPDPDDALSGERAAPGEAGLRYHLKDRFGERLHANGRVMTRIRSFFWAGSLEEVRRMKARNPKWAALVAEVVP